MTVWAVVSLFVHVTVLPLGTVTVAGLKARPFISTCDDLSAWAPAGIEPVRLGAAAGGTELAEPEQPAVAIKVNATNAAIVSLRIIGSSWNCTLDTGSTTPRPDGVNGRHGMGRSNDHSRDLGRVADQGHVAPADRGDDGASPVRHRMLGGRRQHLVLLGHDEPRRKGLPRR